MQSLWLHELEWDSCLSPEIVESWEAWEEKLPCVNEVQIARWNHFSLYPSVFELHGFTDAFKLAYGGVIYLRIVKNN